MAKGRTRQLSIRPGMDANMLNLISEQRTINKEFDRRKPLTSPSVFYNESNRPDATTNGGRIIVVRLANGTLQVQYSDGTTWQSILATSISFATPTITYGTTAAAGALNTTIRSDATLKFPSVLMSTANSSTLTLTDDATDQTLTADLGLLNIVPGSGININFPNSALASLIIKPNTTTAAALTASIQGRPTAGTRALLSPAWFSPAAGDAFSSQTFRCWDAQFSSFAGQHTSSTFVGYDGTVMTISPSASSGAGNKAYGIRGPVPVIGGSTSATWAEIAGAYFDGPRRSIISPTVTLGAGIITSPATGGGTKQVGVLIRQQTAGQTATDRIGMEIEAQNSGTNRFSMKALTDYAWLGGTLFDDNAKGKYGTGRDAELYYDGTNMIIDPDAVGTGRVLIGVTGDDNMLLNAIEIDGDLNHDGANVGFYGVAPTARSAAYTPTNVTADRAYDANATTVDELADVLGSLIADLQLTGIIA